MEVTCGVTLVVGIIAGCITLAAMVAAPFSAASDYVIFALVCLEGAVALGALGGVLCANAGVVQRTPLTVFPIPPEVQEKLDLGQSLEGMANVDGPDGRTFCVRCFVWRPAAGEGADEESCICPSVPTPRAQPHHCSVCGRCVVDFDHHCGVLGRCIAGSGWRGNLRYFYILCSMAPFALTTVMLGVFVRSAARGRSTLGGPL